jgi:GrpB-like predicted nucleotidyltransferase (UPF0157 family)
VLGLRRRTVRLSPHDPAWADRAREVIGEIATATGIPEDTIQHVGSTAVPGLLAKPILDIDLAIGRGNDVEGLVERLVHLGFIDRGDGEGGIGRLLVWETAPDIRTVHVHITPFDSPWWRHDLAFRDALRDDSVLRQRYAEVKADLARQFPEDRKSYREAKNSFIEATLQRLGATR